MAWTLKHGVILCTHSMHVITLKLIESCSCALLSAEESIIAPFMLIILLSSWKVTWRLSATHRMLMYSQLLALSHTLPDALSQTPTLLIG